MSFVFTKTPDFLYLDPLGKIIPMDEVRSGSGTQLTTSSLLKLFFFGLLLSIFFVCFCFLDNFSKSILSFYFSTYNKCQCALWFYLRPYSQSAIYTQYLFYLSPWFPLPFPMASFSNYVSIHQ